MSTIDSLTQTLTISSETEVKDLARSLANDYIDYLDIDISQDQNRYQDSVEECLAHLEEVISALDNYKQDSEAIEVFVNTVSSKQDSLNKLFNQVDSIEQYVFETNRLLDEVEASMKELEKHQNSKDGKVKQLLHMIPGISRLGFLTALGGFVQSTHLQDFVETQANEDDDQQLTPINEILDRLNYLDATLRKITSDLCDRLHGNKIMTCSKEIHESMSYLSLNSPEDEDGSLQELL